MKKLYWAKSLLKKLDISGVKSDDSRLEEHGFKKVYTNRFSSTTPYIWIHSKKKLVIKCSFFCQASFKSKKYQIPTVFCEKPKLTKDKFAYCVQPLAQRPKIKEIRQFIKMADVSPICFPDYHEGNVMKYRGKLVLIDW